MKPRALKTYKILAVTLAAAAGCTKSVGSDTTTEPTAEQIRQEAAAARSGDPAAPAQAVNAPGHATEAPNAPAIAEPPADRPMSNDPALLTLRGELGRGQKESALARVAHFRPLCDKDGYPLVGNVAMGKGENPHYQPSAFCEEVRQQGKR